MVKRKTNHFSPFLIISYISKSISLNDTLSQVWLNWPSGFGDGSRFLKVANFFLQFTYSVSTLGKGHYLLFRMTQRCRMRSVKFHPKMFWAKFSWNWSIEIDFKSCQCIFTVYLPLETFGVPSWLNVDLKI